MKLVIVICCMLTLSSCTKIEQRIADSVVSKRYGEIVLHKWKIISTSGSVYDEVTFHIGNGVEDAKVFAGQQQIGYWGADGDDPSDLTQIRIIITSSTATDIFGQTAYMLTANEGDPNDEGVLTFSGNVDLLYNFISGTGLDADYANTYRTGQFIATAYPNRISW